MTSRTRTATHNPIATPEQRELEDRGMRLLADPAFARIRPIVDFMFRAVWQVPAAAHMDRFDSFVDEYIAHFAFRYAAVDGQYPGVLRFMDPPHRWMGRDVPGTRWGGATPDFTYRVMPVEHASRYRIKVTPTCDRPPTQHFSLMAENGASPIELGVIETMGMTPEADGSYLITVDGDAADGRANHLQTRPGAYQIWVRDAALDWVTDTPNAIEITLEGEPNRPPLDDATLAARAVKAAMDGLYYQHFVCRLVTAGVANAVVPPASSAAFGGVATQFTARAFVTLAPDEAMVLRATTGGAVFRDALLYDHFQMTIRFWESLTSFQSGQMTPDADGNFTYVIAHQDPGVANWFDTNGMGEVLFGHRWQAFPGMAPAEAPTLTGKVVKFADLEKVLGSGVARVDAAGRASQIDARRAGYAARFSEN